MTVVSKLRSVLMKLQYSQGSTSMTCSQTASDMSTAVYCTKEEYCFPKASHHSQQCNCPVASYSTPYTSLEDVNFSFPKLSNDVSCSPKHIEDNILQHNGWDATLFFWLPECLMIWVAQRNTLKIIFCKVTGQSWRRRCYPLHLVYLNVIWYFD